MNEDTKLIIAKVEAEIREASTHFELVLDLFGTKESLSVVNKSAPAVFIIIRQSLLDAAIIRLNRLCDPPGTKNRNIGLASLRESLDQTDHSFINELKDLEDQIRDEVRKLKKYRDKVLAHNDYKAYKDGLHKTISNSAIDVSLRLLESYINRIYVKLENYSVSILDIPYSLGDGPEKLMRLIEEGINCQKSG